jgi:hypothetical protein
MYVLDPMLRVFVGFGLNIPTFPDVTRVEHVMTFEPVRLPYRFEADTTFEASTFPYNTPFTERFVFTVTSPVDETVMDPESKTSFEFWSYVTTLLGYSGNEYRIGATYNPEYGASRLEPRALITIEFGTWPQSPAYAPIAIDAEPCWLLPAPVPMAIAEVP